MQCLSKPKENDENGTAPGCHGTTLRAGPWSGPQRKGLGEPYDDDAHQKEYALTRINIRKIPSRTSGRRVGAKHERGRRLPRLCFATVPPRQGASRDPCKTGRQSRKQLLHATAACFNANKTEPPLAWTSARKSNIAPGSFQQGDQGPPPQRHLSKP